MLITGLRIAGVPHTISALGQTGISGLELNPDQNHLEVEFASFNFQPGAAIVYQYRLNEEWSAPSETRNLHLAGLASGDYRLEIRALRDGVASPAPAWVSFHILAPVWRRWSSVTTAILLFAALLYGGHRYRVGRVLEMERVRTRIAMDLHDDIGSSLSQIAILSEIVRHQAGGESSQRLARVAEISRELVDAMSDIVWAINNIARHSGCRRAQADLTLSDRRLQLVVSDSGAGFEVNGKPHGEGHGLASMQKRAAQLGGSLEIRSRPDSGTTIICTVPLPRRYLNMW